MLDFQPVDDMRVGTHREGIEVVYDTPSAEFAGSVLILDGEDLGHEVDAPSRHDGPQILVCTQGRVTARPSPAKCGSSGDGGMGRRRRPADPFGGFGAQSAVPRYGRPLKLQAET